MLFNDNTDLVAVLHQEVCATAACFGLPAGTDLAASIIDRVMLRLGGCEVYVPKRAGRAKRASVHQHIRARFNGSNVAELAQEAGMSERQVRRIVRQ
ncbi:MAG: hypothetical protein K2Y10_11000 [Burkholderiaceae bacterium]|nr:hypothetical protein [Burkholderiaceae bacterium]